jgi:hypothetical protein
LAGLSKFLRESFFEIAFGGPVSVQTFTNRRNPIADLRNEGLIQYDAQTKLFSVTRENAEAARAIRAAELESKDD